MYFHGWEVYRAGRLWECKNLSNCSVQAFYYIIDALIYCKKHSSETLAKEPIIEKVMGQMRLAREIRKARKSGNYSVISKDIINLTGENNERISRHQ